MAARGLFESTRKSVPEGEPMSFLLGTRVITSPEIPKNCLSRETKESEEVPFEVETKSSSKSLLARSERSLSLSVHGDPESGEIVVLKLSLELLVGRGIEDSTRAV